MLTPGEGAQERRLPVPDDPGDSHDFPPVCAQRDLVEAVPAQCLDAQKRCLIGHG